MTVAPTAPPKAKIDPRLNPRNKPFQPFGGALKLFYDKNDEILYCGPAGTGKSRASLEKLHFCASKYPGSRHLMLRKTRESLTQSALVTFENFVIPDNGTVMFRTAEQEYRYANGSRIVLGGMDKATKVLSSEYDIVYVMQAEELTEDEWEHLITRNRYGVVPYNQLIADVNPSFPTHWLRRRAETTDMSYIKSIHRDNPTLYDQVTGQLTLRGEDYMGKLDKLTGVRRKRLRDGIWAAAEGMVLDEWNEQVHHINRFRIPESWARLWVVDFGFTNPFCWQAWAIDETNDKAYMFAEIYYTRRLVEDHAGTIRDWMAETGERIPEGVICDWDAEGRATLEKHLEIETIPADKAISDGIEAVKSRLKNQDDETPGLYILRDSLVEKDLELEDAALPTCTVEEIPSWEWDMGSRRRGIIKIKEQPVDKDNHGMDCTRYLCKHVEGEYGGWSMGMTS